MNVSVLYTLYLAGAAACICPAAEEHAVNSIPREGPGAISAEAIDRLLEKGAPEASKAELETVSIALAEGAALELTARVVKEGKKRLHPEVCIFEGQLWVGSVTSPPHRVMHAATHTLNGDKIPLDVSGLADPWINPAEMTSRDVRLRCFTPEEGSPVYTLDICFFKGGALDYLVSYTICCGKSLRTKIEFMGDTYPDWYPDWGKE